MNVVGSDSTESRRAAAGIGVHVDLDVGDVGQVGAHLVDHPPHPGARSAPDRAEVHHGRPVRDSPRSEVSTSAASGGGPAAARRAA